MKKTKPKDGVVTAAVAAAGVAAGPVATVAGVSRGDMFAVKVRSH